jgi:hypothetical protein
MSSNALADRLMAVLDAVDQHPADKTVALSECIARLLMLHLSDDEVTARDSADTLTKRLIARITEAGFGRSGLPN